jgi:hypothetical protein
LSRAPRRPSSRRRREAELTTRLGIGERRFQARLRDANGERADADAALVERAHHDRKAAPLFAEQRVRAKVHRLEIEGADGGGPLPHLMLATAARDAGPVELDDENAHAALPHFLVGAGEHEADICDRRIVNPQFGA